MLGCNIPYLLNSRISEAVKFAGIFNETNIYWFLSGGIKNLQKDTISEANIMAKHLENYENNNPSLFGNKWNYVYDMKSTNTAENFIMANTYINNANINYSEVFIITSEFHYCRANKIAERIFVNNNKIKWVLADAKLPDSLYWEKIHIKNVDDDVNKAIHKFYYYS